MAVLPATQERLQIKHLSHSDREDATVDGQDVIDGLSQNPKTLPPKYFYDSYGSQLFEQICELPEYYPTRTEDSILNQYADEIAQMTGACELVELGSGSSTKTRRLLDAYQTLTDSLHYIPIDVSGSILTESAQQLLQEYPHLQIQGLVGTYEEALVELERTPAPSRMVFFLGSSLGNLNPQECDRFFDHILDALHMGEYFLLGVDLQKPKDILEAAYNDAQGVTAEFNLNMLDHLNQRFGGNFKRQNFEHWAFYNQELNQIEMHLRCLSAHSVELAALDFQVKFETGETIRTEISRKFNVQTVQDELAAKGLKPITAWTDSKRWFGLILSQKV
ncbi:L-histidine N(alpha)-methyltransferase [Roseofilum capinflatum]|uniref:L-histidine N(Alpha)-methyltransferase n=1 Tax=Roseofilum capinflatum BLCC-M114 TaxID=3022440 RepID=A0ABT7BBU8_9CYAN|nr:L-histidine N(alpha)-methyltransferase [Roseofilum capinflatum]MDJ1176636.1 L-histidine N(alpha)-methyltransferase [Roseofilum capinflatum BLCC-M114]